MSFWCFFVNFEDILQPILVLLLLTLNMHLFAGMAVSFIFFGVCYIFLFDKIRKSKSIYLHIPVFYKNFCRLNLGFFKRKLLDFLSGHFFKTFFGCWHIFMWLLKYALLDVYIRLRLLRDNSIKFNSRFNKILL